MLSQQVISYGEGNLIEILFLFSLFFFFYSILNSSKSKSKPITQKPNTRRNLNSHNKKNDLKLTSQHRNNLLHGQNVHANCLNAFQQRHSTLSLNLSNISSRHPQFNERECQTKMQISDVP